MLSTKKKCNVPSFRSTSIRRRILSIVLLLLTGMSILIGIASFKDASHEIEEIFDARLAQNARILQAFVIGIHKSGLDSNEEQRLHQAFEDALLLESSASTIGHKYEGKIAYQVWQGDQLLMRSANSPAAPVMPATGVHVGFNTLEYNDRWITFTLETHSQDYPFTVVVAEREDVRGELVGKVMLQTLIPDVIGIPALAALLWWAVGWGLAPLKELTNLIKQRTPDNLDPIQLSKSPSELEPIQQALNTLLNATQTMLGREQRLIADAAHELRTPLTVLRIHADNAVHAKTVTDRHQALEQLTRGVDRSTRIVGQLLTLARLDPDIKKARRSRLNLLQASRQYLADLMPIAWQAKIDVSLESVDNGANKEDSWVYIMEDGALEIVLQNLITNAVKFSSEESTIEVLWTQNEHEFILTVQDHGCGVSPERFSRLTERFYREGNETGAGLGLSIVQRITERHSGNIELTNTQGGGLSVNIIFPKNKSDAPEKPRHH